MTERNNTTATRVKDRFSIISSSILFRYKCEGNDSKPAVLRMCGTIRMVELCQTEAINSWLSLYKIVVVKIAVDAEVRHDAEDVLFGLGEANLGGKDRGVFGFRAV